MVDSICIIDDDMVSQFATRYCLKQYVEDGEVITCNSAEEGLELCSALLKESKNLPEIIFLDLSMDGMDGWDFIKNLEVLCQGNIQPSIFILSAFSNSKDREIAKQHSMIAGYFDKPLTKLNLEKVFGPKRSSELAL
ncbi:response regulator [Croceivirga thetidis]|uniref:Response regulator n=1 Tax=Croceivirga thetidis TaxID=2721623 RepID=A0ABX1GPC4_9FLAO|nr:response regulator [Croceivirga thetidis]